VQFETETEMEMHGCLRLANENGWGSETISKPWGKQPVSPTDLENGNIVGQIASARQTAHAVYSYTTECATPRE
jgi:hypothetical protein